MSLSYSDKIALMLTSARTFSNVGALIGISHQRASYILHSGKPVKDPALREAIDFAFGLHKREVSRIARAEKLPYDPELPVLASRLPLKSGKLGDRVSIKNTKYLPTELRNKVIHSLQRTGFYYGVSLESIVNLQIYNSEAEKRIKASIKSEHRHRSQSEKLAKLQIALKLIHNVQRSRMFTPMQPMASSFPGELTTDNLNDILRQRHEPATGDKGTATATSIYLQATPPTIKKTQNAKSVKRHPRARAKRRN